MAKKEATATVKVTQTGSPIRRSKDQLATLKGLGLGKMHKTVELGDTPEGRGMIRTVQHMVSVAGCRQSNSPPRPGRPPVVNEMARSLPRTSGGHSGTKAKTNVGK